MSSRPERGGVPDEKIEMFVDETSSFRQLAIVEKYERFVEYLYPVLQNCPRRRLRVLRRPGREEELIRFASSWTGHAQWADAQIHLRSLQLEAQP